MNLLKRIFKPMLPRTTLNRENEKYYVDMQKLTSLEENMTEEEYEKTVFQMMCRIPIGRLIEVINKSKYIKANIVR